MGVSAYIQKKIKDFKNKEIYKLTNFNLQWIIEYSVKQYKMM